MGRWVTRLACFLLAFIPAGLAGAADAPLRLVAPQAGATLVAGATAELAWEPLEPLSGTEEWEAFLSLDGGATYPVRITPHLDRSLRRIDWQVPPVPTADARILVRLGDERRETAVELPQRFSIAVSPALLRTAETTLALSRQSPVRGEPALPGHAGVVVWTEGTRSGGGLRQVVAAEPLGLRARLELPEVHEELAVLGAETAPSQSLAPAPARGVAADRPAGRRAALRIGTPSSPACDILLLIQRLNE
jgi:hypothetical protein